MTVERVAGFCFCIVITSVAATGQTGSESTAQEQKGPTTSVVERTYATGDLAPWRRVQTRTTSGSRQVVVETFEYPDHGEGWLHSRDRHRNEPDAQCRADEA